MPEHVEPSPASSAERPRAEPPAPRRPTVVGIGASAGGLQALKRFFAAVPAEGGLAYVVVVHLAQGQESYLADLLQPHAPIPVTQVTEPTPLEPDRVYVIPPGRNLSAVDSHLRLSPLESDRSDRAPIDHFFRTLAATHDGHSVAVVLSGTGSDGAQGVRHVREAGGLVVVQDPAEAEFDGMPRSAIDTGVADLVLPIAEIPRRILGYDRTQPRVQDGDGADGTEGAAAAEERDRVHRILTQVRVRTGQDFGRYKRSTIERRIERRMQLQGIEQLPEYLATLRESPQEAQALADDLLINVTSFFRDRAVFEHLEREVVPRLFEGKRPQDRVRIWSVGCATGEEAFSLGMLLLEAAARHDAPPAVQVFASDLHERSLRHAREGLYPETIAADVSPERLERFFQRENGSYRVRKELRDLIVFAPHNLLRDPPFSRLDLVACRNVLIYLQREVQQEVIEVFHYALQGEGYLLLGTAETLERSDLFRPQSKEHHLYRRRNVLRAELRLPSLPMAAAPSPPPPVPAAAAGRADAASAYGALHQRMVEQFAPPSLLVNAEHNVLHLSEQVGRYLQVQGGSFTNNVFKLVREELRLELRAALHLARERQATTRSRPIPVRLDGEPRQVVLRVSPAGTQEAEGLVLVIFDELGDSPAAAEENGSPVRDGTAVRELETELEMTRSRLQALVEEYETSQEEMRASNEELQSANEELRSTMEELETSKEELQSINEELQTLNQENRHRVEELSHLSSDLQNLLKVTDVATLFLDRGLRILRFTPRVGELFNVRNTDRGRPLADLTHRLGYAGLLDDARAVLETLVPVEREVESEGERWHLVRVLPYRTVEDRIEGVVITLVDVTRMKRVEAALAAEKTYAESIVETLHEPLLVLTPDLRVRSANQAFYEHFEVRPARTEGELIYNLGNGQWDIPELRTLLEDVLPDSSVFNDYEVTHGFEDIGQRVMLLNARRLDHAQLILLGIRDITEKKRAEERQAFLLHLSDELRAQPDEQSIKTATVRMLGEHLRVDRCYLSELDEQRGMATIGPEHSRPDLPPISGVLQLSDFPESARQMATEQMVVTNSEDDPRLAASGKVLLENLQLRAVLAMPLRKGGRGVVFSPAVGMTTPRTWTEGERALLEAVAERAWSAIERARAEAALRVLNETLEQRVEERTAELVRSDRARSEALRQLVTAAEEERRRISRELHDQMAQLMTALLLGLKTLEMEIGDADHAARVRGLEELADRVAREMQQMAVQLRPPVLDNLGLRDALQNHLEEWSARYGIAADLHAPGLDGARLPPEIESTLYRVVQEGLNNVVRHAGARRVGLVVERRHGAVTLILEDDGAGMDVREALARSERARRLGVSGMRERVALLGGALEIESSPGSGTTLFVRIPDPGAAAPQGGEA